MTGARPFKGIGLPELHVLRDLQLNAVGISENQKEKAPNVPGDPQD